MFNNDYKAVKSRLGYCFDLLTAKDMTKEQNSEKNSLLLKKKINTLRALIAGQNLPAHEILLTSNTSMFSFFKDQIKAFEDETDEAEKAKKLLRLKNFIDVQTAAINLDATRMVSMGYERNKVATKIAENASLITGLVKHTVENSKIKGMFDPEKARSLIDEEARNTTAYNAQYSAAWKVLVEKHDSIRGPFLELRKKMFDELEREGSTLELRETIRGEYAADLNALEQKADEEYKKLKASLFDDLEANYQAQKNRIAAEKIAMARAVKNAVIDQSTVTQEDAEKWIAEKVTITQAVINKMKKNGITPEKFHQDLKDFFVITNGRLGKIKIDTKNHQRAYASETTTHATEGFIMLDNDFSQRVLWHELAHHLESDDNLRVIAQEYIKSRSLDGKLVHRLRNLTENKGFAASEKAYKTDMFNHYVAKIYDHGSTEVFSMGVEVLYDDAVLFDTMLKDPKTIEFVTGALMQTKQEVDLINQQLRDSILNINADIDNLRTEQYQEVFEQLAGLVKFSTTVNVTEADFTDPDATRFFSEWKSKFYGTLTLPNGRELVLLKSGKVKYRSFRGRAMKGVFALDFGNYEHVREAIAEGRYTTYFAYGYGVKEEVALAIQTQDLDRIKVLALSMDLHKVGGYSIPNTSGEIGEGFTSFESLDNLKRQYLQG